MFYCLAPPLWPASASYCTLHPPPLPTCASPSTVVSSSTKPADARPSRLPALRGELEFLEMKSGRYRAAVAARVKDIAKAAGVSKATVSRVLSGNAEYMRPETRARVLEAIDKLDEPI